MTFEFRGMEQHYVRLESQDDRSYGALARVCLLFATNLEMHLTLGQATKLGS